MRTLLLVCGLAAALLAQSPRFEVASVKPAAPSTPGQMQLGMQMDGAQVHFDNQSLQDLIARAYDVRSYQIAGPDWLGKVRFDISAKLPAGATSDQVPAMLQALLAQRFALKAHHDSQSTPVYVLGVASGGLKAHPVAASDATAPGAASTMAASGSRNGVSVALGPGSSFSLTSEKVEATHLTLPQLADIMSRFLDRPVVDRTDTAGSFDFTLPLTPELYNALLVRSALNSGVELPPQALGALQAENPGVIAHELGAYGLTLDARNAPLGHLIVDRIERAPSADN